MELGLVIKSSDVSVSEFATLAKYAEYLGYSSLWTTEDLSRSAFGMLMAGAEATSKIELGTSIVNVYSRTPLTLAMEASTLDEASGSRFVLGLGNGGIDFVTRGHGMAVEQPALRMKECAEVVRAYLSGNRVNYSGKFFTVRDISLWIKPHHSIPIFMAALNKKTLEMAGQIADGLILNMFSLSALDYVKRNISVGLSKRGRKLSKFKILSFILCPTSKEMEFQLARAVSFYCAAPTYRKIISLTGFAEDAENIGKIWRSGQHERAARLVPEDLIKQVSICSDIDEGIKRICRYSQNGIVPLLYLQPPRRRAFSEIKTTMANMAKPL